MLIRYYYNNNKDCDKYHTAKLIGKKVNLGLSIVRLVLNFLGSFYFSSWELTWDNRHAAPYQAENYFIRKKYAKSKYSAVFFFHSWNGAANYDQQRKKSC